MAIFNTVYGGEPKWKPWTDTVAYYKFDWNLNDSSWNWYDITLYTWSVTYWTASWWWKYAYFNRDTWTNYRSRNVNYDWPNTISFFINLQEKLTWWTHDIVELWYNGTNNFIRFCNSIDFTWRPISTTATTDLSSETRYLITVAFDWTTFHFYKNGVEFATSWKSLGWTYNSRFRINQVPDTNSNTYSNNMYISELIWEEKYWSADNVLSYYNRKKANYGL